MTELLEKFNWSIIGHLSQIKFLQKSLINKQLSHAYLFCGPKNIGKKTIATLFSQTLICDNFKHLVTDLPCNHCQSCQQFIKGIYPDYFEINLLEDKKEISIEQIKELQYHLKLKSFLENYKITIISEAEKLNKESANALLKTLEEPFEKTIIILITTDLRKIPTTIISRCQLIKFNFVSDDLIYNYLLKKGETRENIRLITKLLRGRPGLIFQSNFSEFLNNYKQQINFLEKLIAIPIHQKIKSIALFIKEESHDKHDKLEEIINLWLIYFHDLFLLKSGNSEKIINQNHLKNLQKLEKTYSLNKIVELIKNLSQFSIKIQLNLNSKILIENLIINI